LGFEPVDKKDQNCQEGEDLFRAFCYDPSFRSRSSTGDAAGDAREGYLSIKIAIDENSHKNSCG